MAGIAATTEPASMNGIDISTEEVNAVLASSAAQEFTVDDVMFLIDRIRNSVMRWAADEDAGDSIDLDELLASCDHVESLINEELSAGFADAFARLSHAKPGFISSAEPWFDRFSETVSAEYRVVIETTDGRVVSSVETMADGTSRRLHISGTFCCADGRIRSSHD